MLILQIITNPRQFSSLLPKERSTICGILEKYEMTDAILFKKTHIRRSHCWSPKKMKKIKFYLLTKGLSKRQTTRNWGLDQRSVHKIKVRLDHPNSNVLFWRDLA